MNLQGNVESPSILASFFIELSRNDTVSEIITKPKVFIVYVRQKMKNIFDTSSDKFRITDWYPLGIVSPVTSLRSVRSTFEDSLT